jgi:hypothetical protein
MLRGTYRYTTAAAAAVELARRSQLDDLRDVDGVAVDAVVPGPVGGCLDGAEALPDGAVALEPAAEADLPDAVTSVHAALGLDVGELVPERAAGRVAEPVQRHAGRLHVPRRQLQVLLQLVDHGAAAGVDAEVLERQLEVRDVGLPALVDELAPHQPEEEEQLLRHGQHQRADRRDVGLERVAGDGHQLLGERDARVPLVILLLVHAPVRAVVGALVRPHHVHQPVLGAAGLAAPVGQQDRRRAHPEEAVGQQHVAPGALVEVGRDDLRGHHERVRVRVHLTMIHQTDD